MGARQVGKTRRALARALPAMIMLVVLQRRLRNLSMSCSMPLGVEHLITSPVRRSGFIQILLGIGAGVILTSRERLTRWLPKAR